ncbi:hypothetical protein [Leptospira noumeaensis]|uniref:hypothetical protein n=1 Tax=Leptospira noumeaensis TaxID=2484964 RepID=UPI00142E1663|nr:hypothetical protein [Leptospira noumeaensis]
MKQCIYFFSFIFFFFGSLSADPISPKKGDRVEVYDAKQGKLFPGMVVKIE